MSALLTLILPTYNCLSGVERNLFKLAEQVTEQGDYVKILVSDDSTNDQIKNHFINKYSHISNFHFIEGPRCGAVANWNKCIQDVNSEYIMYLHHDEYFSSEKFLSLIVNQLRDKKFDVLILPLLKIKSHKKFFHYPTYLKKMYIKFPFLLYSCNSFGSPSVFVVKKSFLEMFDTNLNWYVDVEWYCRILMKKPSVGILNDTNLIINSDLDFGDNITNSLMLNKVVPSEKKYLIQKLGVPKYIFSPVFFILKFPIFFYRIFK